MKIGIVGGMGWMGGAFGRALLAEGIVAPEDLMVLTRSAPPETGYFGHASVHWARDAAEMAAACAVIVLAVRPADWPAVALRAPGRLVLSFMAGVSADTLEAATGARVIRAIPNAAAGIGASYTPYVAGPTARPEDCALVGRLLEAIGTTDLLPAEDQLDLMTALSGAGPAFPALMASVMLDVARAAGVPETAARQAVEAVVCAAPRLLEGQIEAASALVAEYVDYAGTTAAGLRAACDQGFEDALRAGLDAATRTAREMTASATRT
ncbi:pyrroline-5-carboxylate reductase family protein [Phaeovulum vinaykumarii]|uniref:Pyrroline-5-carboxylate reductase n=1 Tax=Phaeovulum vinaykumarii TaxID=407234 RepID=A0A1N7LLL3_9RHOB|nr:pyrroline-5-carboxylate reductase dimerization domain-containing protein [Phaeovulum vinaykumarii]SIS74682.1 pyrroline-5-carboxylate reductase [Phaeovulum vinaykumarii]SOC05193.1 pyrroline-5-carboxylate reductase [Phaeovulum vinaykumarii]